MDLGVNIPLYMLPNDAGLATRRVEVAEGEHVYDTSYKARLDLLNTIWDYLIGVC